MDKLFYDITLDISLDTIVYPGDPQVVFEKEKSISAGDGYNLSRISLGSHTGTHIDAPKHFYDDGVSVDKLPIDTLVGKAKVFEIRGKEQIEADDLKKLDIKKGDIIILKTDNSYLITKGRFNEKYTYIAHGAAEYLSRVGIKTLGFDYISVEKYDSETAHTHYTLLKENIVIIEGLVLEDVEPGEYEMIAMPLKIKDGDGSPARVVLIR
ncbi:MAG: cyclase family protein [Clostridia bacterium]|nr:cyclase family protein [Clostridia bacterium]